jgi:hypothetical protein
MDHHSVRRNFILPLWIFGGGLAKSMSDTLGVGGALTLGGFSGVGRGRVDVQMRWGKVKCEYRTVHGSGRVGKMC